MGRLDSAVVTSQFPSIGYQLYTGTVMSDLEASSCLIFMTAWRMSCSTAHSLPKHHVRQRPVTFFEQMIDNSEQCKLKGGISHGIRLIIN